MIEISCLYLDYNVEHVPLIFIFIKYEKFMKIFLQEKEVVIAIENLKNFEMLFDFYILSLLCVNDDCTSTNYDSYVFHGISTHKYENEYHSYRDYHLVEFVNDWMKNPFLSQEPKRETSAKKINKLLKIIYNFYKSGEFEHPVSMIETFEALLIDAEYFNDFIRYEKKRLEFVFNLC